MSTVIDVLRMQAESLRAARDTPRLFECNEAFVRGLNAGLTIAIDALEDKLRFEEQWAAMQGERDKTEADAKALREQFAKATAPHAGTLRIDARPEDLAERQRMIDNGEVPF